MTFDGIQLPADATHWNTDARLLFAILTLAGVVLFGVVIRRRLSCLLQAAPDPRFEDWTSRFKSVLRYWFVQWKQPRYFGAGILHIGIFAGFLILLAKTIRLTLLGILGARSVSTATALDVVFAYTETIVFAAVIAAATRRVLFNPARYRAPEKNSTLHRIEPIAILSLIAILMLSSSLLEAVGHQLTNPVSYPPIFSLAWMWSVAVRGLSVPDFHRIYFDSYLAHQITLLAFLCLLPFGKHFHVLTSFFNILFVKKDRHSLKPVRWGATEQELAVSASMGVKTFHDFTWKHVLDFYTCADCGRCSDQCPSNATGRALSPRFLTIKARDYCFNHHPVFGRAENGMSLVGNLYSEEEIWSCTTCGACEEECPLLIEYIDKIVDLRRGLVDEGRVPASLQKPLKALESRGNPYGKLEKKRADWAKQPDFQRTCPVPIVNGTGVKTLYFVDSITSYDDRMQSIARASSLILHELGEESGILGAKERDSGHEARRFGEETLFFALRDHNTEAIKSSGAESIVVSDPHTYNALKRDYYGLPPVQHISEVLAQGVESGRLRFLPLEDDQAVYAYHDPCYLGRHNQIYDAPRAVLDAIPGLKRIEMKRCRDRSFCCGGGGLMLFYEPKQEERMGVVRVQMAAEAGASVIVTACPYCLTNIEDAIKVAGMERRMAAIDLAELANQQMVCSAKTAQS